MEHLNPARGANEWADTYGTLGAVPQARLTNLPLQRLDPWESPDGRTQPFRPYTSEKLTELSENVQKNGVIEPICVRPMPNGRFQIIAGHNRVAASKLAGLTTIPAIIRQLSDEEAEVAMVDSNLQHREKLLPSEKAFAYKLRLDAMKRQGQRTDLTLSPVGTKLRSSDKITAETGDSKNQIHRYIRLTYLHATLLKQVDDGKLSFRAGVELSYLQPEEQELLLRVMQDENVKTVSLKQSQALRTLSKEADFSEATILLVFFPTVEQKQDVIKLPAKRLRNFFPPSTSAEEMEAEIIDALTAYRKKTEHTPASV